MTQVLKFLAFDTSTDMMSVALSQGDQTWHHHGVGGANASAQLIPTVHALLAQAQLQLSDLTALVVGQDSERPVRWRKDLRWVPI
jgi:tRNA threonylcarbamoyladenosine biosynthesis protein TsaB